MKHQQAQIWLHLDVSGDRAEVTVVQCVKRGAHSLGSSLELAKRHTRWQRGLRMVAVTWSFQGKASARMWFGWGEGDA